MKSMFKNPWQFAFSLAVMVVVGALLMNGMYVEAALLAPTGTVEIEELATEVKRVGNEFKAKHGELVGFYDEVKNRLNSGEALSTELKTSVDKALTDIAGIRNEITDLAQKSLAAAEKLDERNKAEKSWGEQFVEAKSVKEMMDEYKSGGASIAADRSAKLRAELKVVNSVNAGGLIRSYREPGVLALPREELSIRDLLPTIQISTSSVDYAVQSTRTNAAAPVAEAATKPYSDYVWTSSTVVVRTLAHLAKITRQAMDDAPRLMGEIDSEMRYGLRLVEDRQFLTGNGTGQNLHGIMPQATAFARPTGFPQMTGATNIDVLRVAMLQNVIALLPVDGIVLNDIDWAVIELTKTTDGAYLMANPAGVLAKRLWGTRVVTTPAMTADNFLVGNFALGAVIYDRMLIEVLISTENTDDFEKNLATMRAEERVAIAVKRPLAFTKGTFTAAKTALAAA